MSKKPSSSGTIEPANTSNEVQRADKLRRDRNAVERRMLDLAAAKWTPAEIAEEFPGMDAATVYSTLTDLLSAHDIWDDLQEQQLFDHTLWEHLRDLQEMTKVAKSARNFDTKIFADMTNMLRMVDERLNRRLDRNEKLAARVEAEHGFFMVGLIRDALFKSMDDVLDDDYATRTRLEESFKIHLSEAMLTHGQAMQT